MRSLFESLHARLSRPPRPARHGVPIKVRRKRRLVRNLWLGAGLIVLAHPTLATLIVITLLTTFTSFVILDETP